MRHAKGYRRLNRTNEHRKALWANMAGSLIEHEQIKTTLPKAKVYYYEELNCSDANFTWDLERVINNFNAISVLIYQELTTDITGNPN